MRLILLGVSHHQADLDVRERLAIDAAGRTRLIQRVLADASPGAELIVLSTCNRTELYLARPVHGQPDDDALLAALADEAGVDPASLGPLTVRRENEQAVLHLFRVAAGLDSMVLGEPQILGQVRRAYDASNRLGVAGPVMHQLFQQAVAVARDARAASGVDEGQTSIGSIAVAFAQQVFSRFDNKRVLGLGAGAMGKLALTHFASLQPARIDVINRTPARAVELVDQLPGPRDRIGARSLDDLEPLLAQADIVIACAGCDAPLVDMETMRRVVRARRRRPLLALDLAAPRNFAPEAASLANVFLYNLDDLRVLADDVWKQRAGAAEQAERVITPAAEQTMARLRHRDLGRLVRALRRRLFALAELEAQRTMRKLPADEQLALDADEADRLREHLDEHAHRLINKILHKPLSQMDAADGAAPLGFYAAAMRRLFDLDDDLDADPPHTTAPIDAAEKSAGDPLGPTPDPGPDVAPDPARDDPVRAER